MSLLRKLWNKELNMYTRRYSSKKLFYIDPSVLEKRKYLRKDLLSKVKRNINDRNAQPINSTYCRKKLFTNREKDKITDSVSNEEESFWSSVEKAKSNLAGESAVIEYNEKRRLRTIKRSNDDVFTKKLESYLWTCIEVDLINEARSTLGFYRCLHKDRKVSQTINSVAPYNVVMHGLASQNRLDKMRRLLKIMIADGHQPNHQTYSIFLNYLSQQNMTKDIQVTLTSMKKFMDKLGITESEVLSYVKDPVMYNNIVKSFKILDPTFEPLSSTPIINTSEEYTQLLLQPLNEKLNNSQVNPLLSTSMTTETLQEMAKKQLEREQTRFLTVERIDIDKSKSAPINNLYYNEKLKQWEKMWRSALTEKLSSELNNQEQRFKQARVYDFKIYPYLIVLPLEEYVDIMIQKVYNLVNCYDSKSLICQKLGQEVYDRYRIVYMKKHGHLDKINQLYLDYCDHYMKSNCTDTSWLPRKTLQNLCTKNDISDLSSLLGPMEWSTFIMHKLGSFLFQLIVENIHVSSEENGEIQMFRAFYEIETTFAVGHGCFKLYVYPLLEKCIVKANNQSFTYLPEDCPMLAPPMPWTSLSTGGHPYNKNYCIRMQDTSVVQHKRIHEVGVKQLHPFLDSLNMLGSVPMKINKPLLDIVIQLFNSGEYPEVDLPKHPDKIKFPSSNEVIFPLEDNSIVAKFEHNKILRNAFGDWLFMLQKLSIAYKFRDEIIWYPFDGDFRGRAYPCSEYFNHYQSDVMRSLFLFGEGKKVGSLGLKWLKANVMNLAGLVSDQSFEKKVAHCDEIMDLVLDSANNPLTGQRWWMQSGDPWQTLAASMELAAAMKCEDPTEYISHLPITQDGSCNGLQHYAALGRDLKGGELVNLVPSDVKQDVYNEVAKIVDQKRKEDLNSDNEVMRTMAEDLEGLITRKLVKRNVMTTVYGVSLYGAQNQIEQNLKDIDFPIKKRRRAALYVADKVFKSLGDAFTKTRVIQEWLGQSAKIISRVGGRPVEWITPLGLPIIQNYSYDLVKSDVHLCVDCDTNLDYLLRPDLSKQRTAFPANFIHSLDATHMMLTALYCQEAGIYFTSVHDCYWTHAAHIPVMNKICREQFVSLHSLPILEDLGQFHREKFGFAESQVSNDLLLKRGDMYRLNKHFDQEFVKGDLNINDVLNSEFFFS